MSKKSRKRNKKILAALALAGGAAMLAKGRRKSVADTAASEDANINVTHPALTADTATDTSSPIIKKPIRPDFSGGIHQGKPKKINPFKGNLVPPSMRGGALHAEGYTPRNLHIQGPRRGQLRGGGIAKRGSGVALKSGGRVKSMGIAKRGGGAAKR
jgi:hypothetical protein